MKEGAASLKGAARSVCLTPCAIVDYIHEFETDA